MNMREEIYGENGDYLKKNPTWHVEDSPWKAKQIIKMINKNDINVKSVAEIGCGAGEILNQLFKAMSNDVIFKGYDISIDAIKFAKKVEKERLTYINEDLLSVDQFYDLLLVMDVFEHVDDYIGFLRSCKSKAKYKIFHIPLDINVYNILRNLLITHRKSVGHLHYFTKETAIETLLYSGHEILDFFYTDAVSINQKNSLKAGILGWAQKCLYKINKDFASKALGGYSLLVLTK